MNPGNPFDRSADVPAGEPWPRPAPITPATAASRSWSSAAEPSPAPGTSTANDAPTRTEVMAAPRRTGRRAIGRVLGAALLSAVLASGSTLAIVELTTPGGSPAPTAAAPVANTTTSGGAQTTVQQEDITAVVAKAKDSVVTLTSQIATNRGPFDPGTATGVGSGIILTADGYALTNRHVVQGSESLTATLWDGSEHHASVVQVSDTQDLALVKIDATNLRPATVGDSRSIEVGQTAIAIGSPLGTFTETVTKGIVSALDRSITVRDDETGRPTKLSGLIQTDAAINPGNSGGPLLNAAGDVVGVNTATASTAEGIGFAIPIAAAQSLIDQARTASVA
jgi:S1-C subfamily serine protease